MKKRLDYEKLSDQEKRIWDGAFGAAVMRYYARATVVVTDGRLPVPSPAYIHRKALDLMDASEGGPEMIAEIADQAVHMWRSQEMELKGYEEWPG